MGYALLEKEPSARWLGIDDHPGDGSADRSLNGDRTSGSEMLWIRCAIGSKNLPWGAVGRRNLVLVGVTTLDPAPAGWRRRLRRIGAAGRSGVHHPWRRNRPAGLLSAVV